MPFIANGKIYKSRKAYFLEMNPDDINATQNDIDRYIYHNVKEYRDHKRSFYRERYRNLKNNNVRQYIKYENKQPQNASENIEK